MNYIVNKIHDLQRIDKDLQITKSSKKLKEYEKWWTEVNGLCKEEINDNIKS